MDLITGIEIVGWKKKFHSDHYEKIGWFATSHCNDPLQFHCNSMYFYNMSAIGQIASLKCTQLTICEIAYIYNLVAT